MARNMQPIAKRCKALNLSPAAMGYAKKNTNRNPKGQMRKKQSEYALQLTEKQKVKFVYGIMEKQFHMYYEKASRMPGKTGENLLTLIERRLDNVVYRLGFAMTRRERPAGGHPLLPGEGGRRHRGPGEEPFLCQVQAPAGRGRHPGQCAQVAGPREKYPPGQSRCYARTGRHRLPRGRAPHRRAVL